MYKYKKVVISQAYIYCFFNNLFSIQCCQQYVHKYVGTYEIVFLLLVVPDLFSHMIIRCVRTCIAGTRLL